MCFDLSVVKHISGRTHSGSPLLCGLLLAVVEQVSCETLNFSCNEAYSCLE